jgi:hypothetical protein
MTEGCIKETKFQALHKQITGHFKNESCFVFLDNLPIHYLKTVANFTSSLKIELILNAAASSELNPTERLRAWAKQSF